MKELIAWIVVAGFVFFLVILMRIKREEKRKREARAAIIPALQDAFVPGKRYHLHLVSGQILKDVELQGEGESGETSFWKWETMIVVKRKDEKRVFLRTGAVRWVEEA